MTGIDRDRVSAALGVGLLHALLGYAFLTGLALEAIKEAGRTMRVFDIVEPPPPPLPEPPRPADTPAPEREGAAAPPNLKSRPTPVVAPPPEIKLQVPSPIVAAPKTTPLPPGPDPTAGNANRAGSGWGAGGQGSGTGSGNAGDGSGGGGIAERARHIRGELRNSDYPRSALRMGIEGTVTVRYRVEPDGVVTNCVILQTSGFAELDQTTCRLIQRRFEYRPARDAAGRPVPQELIKTYDWWLPSKRYGQEL
jgi:periplasmic protein TonB